MLRRWLLQRTIARGDSALRAQALAKGITPLFISPRTAGGLIHFTLAVQTEAEAARLGPMQTGQRRTRVAVVAQETIDRDYGGNWFNYYR